MENIVLYFVFNTVAVTIAFLFWKIFNEENNLKPVSHTVYLQLYANAEQAAAQNNTKQQQTTNPAKSVTRAIPVKETVKSHKNSMGTRDRKVTFQPTAAATVNDLIDDKTLVNNGCIGGKTVESNVFEYCTLLPRA